MESWKLQLSLVIGLLKLQSNNWQRDIRYGLRFGLCGIFTYISFMILSPLGNTIVGKENELFLYLFENPPFLIVVFYAIIFGYFGLYMAVIAAALFASLLPKT